MKKPVLNTFLLVGTIFLLALSSCNKPAKPDSYLIMLSMDGFRWDYARRVATPNLDIMQQQGVKAEYVIPAFPSKTFPNHYSMATGLYPSNHGIVNNNFYCPELDLTYRLGDREMVENGAFYKGEPIWVTAEKQGVTAASYYWVGSEAPVQGIQPTYWKQYDSRVSFENRIDTVIHWLNLPVEKRPRLITLYFNQPDSHGHSYGPGSSEVDKQVMYVDSLIGVLRLKISELPIASQVNLIVTSDHGMTELSRERFINLSKYLKEEWFEKIQGGNPLYSLKPKEGMADSVLNILKGVDHVKAWKTADIPPRFNYSNNPRILDMIVLADTTWSIGWKEPSASFSGGSHGWDNLQTDMRTIFYACGPAFKQNHIHSPFQVVDIYPLISHILELDPAPVDGKPERIKGMLTE